MFITRETDYAIRIIRDLKPGGRKTIDEICQNEQIPRQFGYKILKKLAKCGMVRIFRGAGGGYTLAADPCTITLYDIVTAIDGELLLCDCLGHDYNCPMKARGKKVCGIHRELARIQNILLGHLKEKALAEIA